MGRHSIPDPEESSGVPPEGAGDATESFDRPLVGPDDYPDYRSGPTEPRYPRHGAPDYGQPDYPDTDYPSGDYDTDYGTDYDADYEADYRTEYSDDYGARYRSGEHFDDEYEPEFVESDYPDSDYSDAPEYRAPGDGREPEPAEPRSGRSRAETPSRAAATPPPRSRRQHSGDWEGGEWTGSHRAVQTGRRGVSVGVIGALVAVVVVVAAFILWRFFGDALSDRSTSAAARCVEGQKAVAVIADPSIAEPIKSLADKFNENAHPVGDICVAMDVKSADSDRVINGFISAWPAELGDRPALWIPASSVSQARLEAVAGEEIVDDSRSLVNTPVVLAVRPELKDALGQQNWGTLPGLQSNPNSLTALDLPEWGSLRLALPLSGDSDASYLAAEAIAAASAPAGQPPSAGTGALNTLIAAQPKLADNKASTALDALVKSNQPATAPVHAVVTTEQQLFQRATSLPDAKRVVASWLPPGPTALADYPAVLLKGNWLSQEQVAAANEFSRFLRKPEQLAELAKLGFRAEGSELPKSDVTNFAPVSAPLSVGDTSMRATLANALTAPAGNPAVTIMLDRSMTAQEGGKSRLANVVAALTTRLQAMPSTAAVGLWTFDGVEGSNEVSLGALSDPVDGSPRSETLSAALDDLSASGGGAVSFTTLRLVYDEANSRFREGQTNSVLVITTGPHTDRSLDSSGLQDYVRRAFDPAKPVAINVIDFGSDSDRATWEAVAETTGGGYQNLSTSASPDLTAAITKFTG